MNRRIHFASFGSRPHYLRLSKQTLRELGHVYPEAYIWPLTLRDLGYEAAQLKAYARQYPRGYGYWRWKPVVVDFMFNSVTEGDVVIYVDGRFGVPKCRIPWIDEFVGNEDCDFVAWQMEGFPERAWTTGDLLAHFGFDINSPEAMSDQFAGGILGFRKNRATAHAIANWRQTVEDSPELCREERSRRPNAAEFQENRFDQSALSLTLKKHSTRALTLKVLRGDDFAGDCALTPQAKQHPRRIHGTEPFFRVGKEFRKLLT